MAEKGRSRRDSGPAEETTQIQRHQKTQDEEELLEKLWKEIDGSETGEDIDPEKFLRDMAILDDLYPLPDFDMSSSWKDFQEKYAHLLASSASADQQSSASDPAEIPKRNRSRKPIRAVIAVVMILVMLMMAASCGVIERFLKAIGIDSEEIFCFRVLQELRVEDPKPEDTELGKYASLDEALEDYNVSTKYAEPPFLEGYSLKSIRVWEFSDSIKFHAKFARNGKEILFDIWHYKDSTSLELQAAEKLPSDADVYLCNGIDHYILENSDSSTTTWISGLEMYQIIGPISAEQSKQMIDSIYER